MVAPYFSGTTQTHLTAAVQPQLAQPIAAIDSVQNALVGARPQDTG